jgi:hypothetical protein
MKTFVFIAFIFSVFWMGMMVASNIDYFRQHDKSSSYILFGFIPIICFGLLTVIRYYNIK